MTRSSPAASSAAPWSANCCCARSATPSTPCRPTSSPTTEIAHLAGQTAAALEARPWLSAVRHLKAQTCWTKSRQASPISTQQALRRRRRVVDHALRAGCTWWPIGRSRARLLLQRLPRPCRRTGARSTPLPRSARHWGVGSGASHLVSGHYASMPGPRNPPRRLHRHGRRAVLFHRLHGQHRHVMPALVGRGDAIFADKPQPRLAGRRRAALPRRAHPSIRTATSTPLAARLAASSGPSAS
jgi:hypothetical protein